MSAVGLLIRTVIPSIALAAAVGCGDDSSTTTAADSSGSGSGSTSTTAGSSSASTSTTAGTTTDGGTGQGSTGSMTRTSPGCGGDPSAIPETLDIRGVDRTYIVSLPADYDPQRPYTLVFAWHARGTNGNLASLYYGVEEASAGNALFVYPDGLDVGGGGTGWDLTPDGRDLEFFDDLYAALTDNLCVDLDRVFSTGHSFGGFMSNAVGCFRGDLMRAIAPVAGGLPGPSPACDGPVAAWIAHNPIDPTVMFSLGEASRDHWVAQNGCGATTAPTDPAPCVTYDGCDAGFPVTWCDHDEAPALQGHDWPSFAGTAIWAFFAQF